MLPIWDKMLKPGFQVYSWWKN